MQTTTNSGWRAVAFSNELTGQTRIVWRKTVKTDDGHIGHLEVYELGGRLYWSANMLVKGRYDLTRLAHGTYAAVKGAMRVAKGRASRVASDTLKRVLTATT